MRRWLWRTSVRHIHTKNFEGKSDSAGIGTPYLYGYGRCQSVPLMHASTLVR
jgi:hypothetical protein